MEVDIQRKDLGVPTTASKRYKRYMLLLYAFMQVPVAVLASELANDYSHNRTEFSIQTIRYYFILAALSFIMNFANQISQKFFDSVFQLRDFEEPKRQ